tara:strand:+ start:14740 stop:15216 length:477 start_codon:yes stop_codon:yes gene_type:complete
MVASSAMAQEARVDQDVFAQCSKQTNQLVNLNAGLKKLSERADEYNRQHDLLRAQLDQREEEVHQIHTGLRGKPIDRKNWDQYDAAFALYEQALNQLRGWNAQGDALGAKYQGTKDAVTSLQSEINQDCGGTWEPAIINKFCDDDSGRHAEFCRAFET